MLDNFLSGTIPFSHRSQTSVPMEELKHGHHFLKVQHRLSLRGFEHESKCRDAFVLAAPGGLFRILDGLRDEGIRYATGRMMLVVEGIHQGEFARGSPCVRFGHTFLKLNISKKINSGKHFRTQFRCLLE